MIYVGDITMKYIKILVIIFGVIISLVVINYCRIVLTYCINKNNYIECFDIQGNKEKYTPQGLTYSEKYDVIIQSSYNAENKISKLMQNEKIIRNRLKIQATVSNAKVFMQIQKEWNGFSNYLWHWTDNQIIQGNGTLTRSDLSDKISADLQKRGMKFVGSVIIYSFLQAVGVINDHQSDCFKKCS